MAFANPEERDELIDLIAQAVIDRIEERDQINGLADMVVARVFALQREEDELTTRRATPLSQNPALNAEQSQDQDNDEQSQDTK